jgi:hypothetical protein
MDILSLGIATKVLVIFLLLLLLEADYPINVELVQP